MFRSHGKSTIEILNIPISRGGLRLHGPPGWNLQRSPISNEEKGGKRIFWDYLRILFIPHVGHKATYFGIGPLNCRCPWL